MNRVLIEKQTSFMRTRENILKNLQVVKSKITDFGVQKIGLFGSYLRNEQT